MRCLSLLLLLFVVVGLSAQDLTQQSSIIKDKLLNLKQETENLKIALMDTTTRLDVQSKILQISQQEQKEWEQKSTSLSASLTTINEKLNDSFKTITDYAQRLQVAMKWVAILGTLVALLLIGKVVGYVLYFKGIKVPRGVDILL